MPIAILFLCLYIIVKFCFTQQLDSLGVYASYTFEAVFVTLVAFYYRKRLSFKFNWKDELKLSFTPALVLGFIVFLLARPLGISIPFDLRSKETILFLLFIGPVLEEFIFRMALWQPLMDLFKKQNVTLIITTLIFSYAHFHSYWFVPAQIFPFIYYQSTYVIFLALYCGYRLIKTNSMISPIAVHMGFNLGFFLGSFL
jgi:membrane protease YdiL (CAAX protease family)